MITAPETIELADTAERGSHCGCSDLFGTLFVVPCSQQKSRYLKDGAMPAKIAYQGQAFQICRRILEREKLKWCVLSAHYGFIWPTTKIEMYDVKMEPVTEETCWDDCFGYITNRQYARLMTSERIVVLGSQLYASAASVLLKRPVEAPVAGMTIGYMVQRLHSGAWLKVPNNDYPTTSRILK
jgi:hypothetical protein